jgi:hypothetical protein
MSHMPASRTPEGDSRICPVCNASIVVDPTTTTGDCPCPRCGNLLWSSNVTYNRILQYFEPDGSLRPKAPKPAQPKPSSSPHILSERDPLIRPCESSQPEPTSASCVNGTAGTGVTLSGLLGELQEIERRLTEATANRRRWQGLLASILSTLRSRLRRTNGRQKPPVISTGASGLSDPWIP